MDSVVEPTSNFFMQNQTIKKHQVDIMEKTLDLESNTAGFES
jgi:hypothetical protein